MDHDGSSKVVKNTVIFTSALVLQKLLSFVFFIFVARLGGAGVTGDYVAALAFASLFAIIADLGLTQVQIRETAKFPGEGSEYANAVFLAKLLLAALAYGALIAVVSLLNRFGFSHPETRYLALAGVVMVVDSFMLTLYGILRGHQNLAPESIFTVVGKAATIVVGVLGLWYTRDALVLILAVLLGSLVSMAGAIAALIRKKFWTPWSHGRHRGTIKKILPHFFRAAWPFALLGLATTVYASLDSVLLSIMKGAEAVGYYSIAAKTINALQFIPSAFVAAIYPAMSHMAHHNPEKLKKIFTRTLQALAIIGAPIALISMVFAREIVTIAYGSDYLPSVPAFTLVVPTIFFVFLTFPVGALLNATGRQKITTLLMVGAVIINAALNFALIPKWSFYGSAIAWFVTNIVWCVAGLITAYRLLYENPSRHA